MKILTPAKINLFLQVIGKRPDGYHELYSLMCCVDLFDTIRMEFGDCEIIIESSHPNIPLDDTNLAYRAAAVFFQSLKVDDGVRILIEKNIPVGAGLGGGSSNAAGVLRGLDCQYGHPFSQERLMTMAQNLGADVPFFLFGKPALASGIGEKLESYPMGLPFRVVLVNPGFEVSTREVFQNLNLGLTNCKKKITKPFFKQSGFDARLHLCNDLEKVTASKYPVIGSIKDRLLSCGALGALMSGSGPTVFGLFLDPDKAEAAKQEIGATIGWDAYTCSLVDGIRLSEAIG